MTNFEKIILTVVGVLVVIVLLVGAIVFRQQKTINALTGGATGASEQLAVQNSAKKNNSLSTMLSATFLATIENISGNQITVNVKLLDFSKPKNPEKLRDPKAGTKVTEDDFEAMEKKITVNTNEKTVFDSKKLSELKAGDEVLIISEESPYAADTVTAEKITYVGTPK